MIYVSVDNNRSTVVGADNAILGYLDQVLRYPTPQAVAAERGIQLPGEVGAWDGWIRLFRIPKTQPSWFPTGLLPMVEDVFQKSGREYQVTDTRDRPRGDVPEPGVQIKLRGYQDDAVQKALAAGRGVLDMPPRSGKTRTMCEIHRQLAVPTIWIAPTDRIVRQTFETLEGFFGKNYAYHLVGVAGAQEAKRRRVVVCTAATAIRLPEEFYKSRECIVVDEWHHGSAPSYWKIFSHCDHIFFRFGMTGTFFRSGQDAMAMHALLSQTIYKVTSQELLDLGYLVPVYAVFVPVPTKRLYGVENNFITGHGKHGIHENRDRNQLVAHTAMMLCQTGRNVLVLVGTKKQGYMLKGILKAMLPLSPGRAQFQTCEFVSTDMDRKKQGEVLASFESGQEVKVLLGTSLLGEGVDLPTADALVLARGEKAEVTLVQSMYRVCTAQPGKVNAIVVDFVDRHHKKLQEHSLERLQVYYNEPTFHVQVLDDPGQFPGWLKSIVPNRGAQAS